ncbi:hypothetical protein GCM10010191_84180 [Actinomadura vinacea]|uniref:Uncharacterized protein n=1 Tax=Actinomadura vinacea TaxID=115336 RepID=A0ABP5XJS3_9ACTN
MTRTRGRSARRQRPANARAAADGMKLHRRTMRLDGREHTIIGLRPGTAVRFSTNLFHGAWHVLSDQHGARMLARLLWGLAYQSRPGTVVVIDRPFLSPTPFDADPADPIVIVPAWHTPFGAQAARALARALPLRGAPDGTVRWRTHGLDAALADSQAWFDGNDPHWMSVDRGLVERVNGLIALRPSSAAEMLRWAVFTGQLDATRRFGMDYAYLGLGWRCHGGEIQIFRDFRRNVSVARRARSDVLARPGAPRDGAELRPLIWDRAYAIKQRGSC